MKLLAAFNLILPFYLFTSSAASLNVGGETHSSEKETNLQLLMKSSPHNKLPPAVEFGLERHLIHKNQQNVRHAEEEEFFTPCMNDLLESIDIQFEYAFAILVEALSASETCSEDGTSCTMDWSDVDLSEGEDVCKENDMELYLVNAEMDGCLVATNDDFVAFNNTGDDYKYSSDDLLDSAESVLLINYPLGCVPTSCDKEEVEELLLPSYESCETVFIENLFLFGEDVTSSTSGSMNPFNKKNQGIGISLMIAGIIGT